MSLEAFFKPFREAIVGINHSFDSPFGSQPLIYTDWTASGRLYQPIEQRMLEQFGPFVGNTHSESTFIGTSMTHAYHYAQQVIKQHVNAGPHDVLLTSGAGMTSAVNKLQRLLGLRLVEQFKDLVKLPEHERPVVFVSHMEHHSNHTSWIETVADVVIVPPNVQGLIEPAHLQAALAPYANRPLKIGAFTACSNVTGICTPYHELAKIMHAHGGWCFVDFAASAPYVKIDMHPEDPAAQLDAIYFSPHKFLGGPGTPGILVFNQALYHNQIPDRPGGGTVNWTNPWAEHSYIADIELREDGGTPAFLQTIRAALAIQLKAEMGADRMLAREHELLPRIFSGLRSLPRLSILANHVEDRLGIFSFYFEHLHYNLVVKLLNDRYGIQVRGGCSCAGTYGHFLLHIDQQVSHSITCQIDTGDLSAKPGWVRMSIHPTTSNQEVDTLLQALEDVAYHGEQWAKDYIYNNHSNEWRHHNDPGFDVTKWFAQTVQLESLGIQ